MKRCERCGRAVDDSPGLAGHESCPWCDGALADDPKGPRTLSDALQVLWSVDRDSPFDGHRAELDLRDLCPGLPRITRDVRIAGNVGALRLLRDGRPGAASRVLQDEAHWHGAYVGEFVAAYASLEPGAVPAASSTRQEELRVTVSFDGNGADSGAVEPLACAQGAEVVLPECDGLRRKGYEFVGWGASRDAAVRLGPKDAFRANADVTLFAQWAASPQSGMEREVASGAASSLEGPLGAREEPGDVSTPGEVPAFRMMLYKDFGDALGVGAPPRWVYVRVEELRTEPGGTVRALDRMDLTRRIAVTAGSGLRVLSTGVYGRYLGAQVEAPAASGAALAGQRVTLSFALASPKGTFRSDVSFRILG